MNVNLKKSLNEVGGGKKDYISPSVVIISVENSLPLATSHGADNSFERPLEDNNGEDFQW